VVAWYLFQVSGVSGFKFPPATSRQSGKFKIQNAKSNCKLDVKAGNWFQVSAGFHSRYQNDEVKPG
jgi:hypothetical protein